MINGHRTNKRLQWFILTAGIIVSSAILSFGTVFDKLPCSVEALMHALTPLAMDDLCIRSIEDKKMSDSLPDWYVYTDKQLGIEMNYPKISGDEVVFTKDDGTLWVHSKSVEKRDGVWEIRTVTAASPEDLQGVVDVYVNKTYNLNCKVGHIKESSFPGVFDVSLEPVAPELGG